MELLGSKHVGPYRIGIVVPLQGTGGMYGPSCVSVCEMAKQELNSTKGIGGREVELVYIDGGREPREVAQEVQGLVRTGAIDAVTGWHISSIRKLLAPMLRGKGPYVYTSLFEGDEVTPGVYCSGENPEQQVFPALKWLRDHQGCRRWYVIGAQYEWPLRSFEKIVSMSSLLGIDIVGSSFIKMGEGAAPQLPGEVAASGCDGVLMLLVGQDAVDFNRNFAEAGLSEKITRYSPLMEENMLLASGYEATENLFSSASYFRSLTSPEALDFVGRYSKTVGVTAPALNNMAQSCYQGIYTLAHLAQRSRGFTVEGFNSIIDGLTFEGPRGIIRFEGNQAVQTVNLARADGFDFHVIETL